MPHLGGILLTHVEEMTHDRFDNQLAAVVGLHGDEAPKNLERTAVPTTR